MSSLALGPLKNFCFAFTAVLWECVEIMKRIIDGISNRDFLINRLRVLPVLVNMLETATQLATIESIVETLDKVTHGINIGIVETFLEELMKKLVQIINSDHSKPTINDTKIKYSDVSTVHLYPSSK